jgi:RNA polymerase sigma-70 factor (ECF subfamily)
MFQQSSSLLSDLIQGNQNSFEKLFHDLFPKLYRFSYDFVKDKETAREIAHESFIKLWEARHKLKPDSNIEAFLFSICKNDCLNFLKHKKVILNYQEVKSHSLTEIEIQEAVLANQNYIYLDFAVLKNQIGAAIRNLPDQCRNVFELSRFKKKKYSEIAVILNISQKTVEAHISLALRKLREDLKEYL